MSETASQPSYGYPLNRRVEFVESIKLFFGNYVNFKGRSSRGAFWWWTLASMLIGAVLGVADGLLFGWEETDLELFSGLFGLATFLPNLAISVRRLHDVGRSGWWLLLVLTIIGVLVLLFWWVQAGERETNKYGPDIEAGKSGADQIAATFN